MHSNWPKNDHTLCQRTLTIIRVIFLNRKMIALVFFSSHPLFRPTKINWWEPGFQNKSQCSVMGMTVLVCSASSSGHWIDGSALMVPMLLALLSHSVVLQKSWNIIHVRNAELENCMAEFFARLRFSEVILSCSFSDRQYVSTLSLLATNSVSADSIFCRVCSTHWVCDYFADMPGNSQKHQE